MTEAGVLLGLTEATSNDILRPALTCQSVASCAKQLGTFRMTTASDKSAGPPSVRAKALRAGSIRAIYWRSLSIEDDWAGASVHSRLLWRCSVPVIS